MSMLSRLPAGRGTALLALLLVVLEACLFRVLLLLLLLVVLPGSHTSMSSGPLLPAPTDGLAAAPPA
jgi:hypothetical protein